eukprot:TRINITY_DN62493_c0_g1_i1.p1 TRINITY_DN62493_c0_g1~~TRINITY_DN62493_c0_g1_i1.p1  ORF type:complete len:877 (+),score=140.77 TRINITY_DN62493_c0_g1_i1:95-2632(+)
MTVVDPTAAGTASAKRQQHSLPPWHLRHHRQAWFTNATGARLPYAAGAAVVAAAAAASAATTGVDAATDVDTSVQSLEVNGTRDCRFRHCTDVVSTTVTNLSAINSAANTSTFTTTTTSTTTTGSARIDQGESPTPVNRGWRTVTSPPPVSPPLVPRPSGSISSECSSRGPIPPRPAKATDYNGISWPEYCFTGQEEEHVFILGDWGGLPAPQAKGAFDVRPADNSRARGFSWPTDAWAQRLVAKRMSSVAAKMNPRYVLNVGDNFYWGGIKDKCFRQPFGTLSPTNQWHPVFEDMYKGSGLDGKPWFGTFGNHDFGGFHFGSAWEQQIAYTWVSDRWILPALYWHQKVTYPSKGVSVDYYMVDSNVNDASHPYHDPEHNICSARFNRNDCAPIGPKDPWDCKKWFDSLWREQLEWLDQKLRESTADWQIVVTHFPPERAYRAADWRPLVEKYGIDIFFTGHRHQQEAHSRSEAGAPYIVAGGGGGVTSELDPGGWGGNDQYGFADMTISKHELVVQLHNQHGQIRRTLVVPQHRGWFHGGSGERVAAVAFAGAPVWESLASHDIDATRSVAGATSPLLPRQTCDGMGKLVGEREGVLGGGCRDDVFMGAQVRGTVMVVLKHTANSPALTAAAEAFTASYRHARAAEAAIAAMAGIEEVRDVTATLSVANDRSQREQARGAIVLVNFTIEVPSDDLVASVDAELLSQSLAEAREVFSWALDTEDNDESGGAVSIGSISALTVGPKQLGRPLRNGVANDAVWYDASGVAATWTPDVSFSPRLVVMASVAVACAALAVLLATAIAVKRYSIAKRRWRRRGQAERMRDVADAKDAESEADAEEDHLYL